MHHALRGNKVEAIQALAAKNADIFKENNSNVSSAALSGNLDVVDEATTAVCSHSTRYSLCCNHSLTCYCCRHSLRQSMLLHRVNSRSKSFMLIAIASQYVIAHELLVGRYEALPTIGGMMLILTTASVTLVMDDVLPFRALVCQQTGSRIHNMASSNKQKARLR
jgi:hypothetical protein